MKKRTEDEIRDYLAKNLDCIEDGMVLIKKEEYLPNDKGASGFIDIFARAKDGKLVIVEIKRNDAAARQAVQELSKYAALLKASRLIKETEYRLLVLSTDWHELLTPFSEFIHATKYDCEGRKIVLGKNGLPTSIEPIEIQSPSRTRKFSSRHYIFEFRGEEAARDAIEPVAEYMQEAGLRDFILALLTLTTPAYGITHLLYFAQQELSFAEYEKLIRKRFSADSIEEFEAIIAEYTEPEDRISEAADKVWEPVDYEENSLDRRMKRAGSQISHPEKANYWFTPERASKVEIKRFGQFEDEFLTDETIISELKGVQSGSDYRADILAQVKSRPEMDALLKSSDNVFFFNSVWRGAVRDLSAYAKGTDAATLQLKAFCNSDIFSTLAGLAIGYPGFLPAFELEITWPDHCEKFFGVIGWNGRQAKFEDIIKSHFDGDDFSYFMYRHFGSHRGINADLMDELGLGYEVWKETDGVRERIRIQGNSIVEVRRAHSKSLMEFLEKNEELMSDLVDLFLKSDQQFNELFASQMEFQFKDAEAKLEKLIEPQRNKSSRWHGDLDKCDACERPFSTAKFMVDAGLKKGGAACLCALCFEQFGIGIGWGKGQLYKKAGDKWPLVAGGPPNDDGDDD